MNMDFLKITKFLIKEFENKLYNFIFECRQVNT
jgi:hypothetical protein